MLLNRLRWILRAGTTAALLAAAPLPHAQTLTLPSLLSEMTDPDAVARFPQPRYESLQASSYDFGVATISVNGKVAAEQIDRFSAAPGVKPVELGPHAPVDNRLVLRCELAAPNARSRGARTFMGLDRLQFKKP